MFVDRDNDGVITAVYAEQQSEGQEEVENTSPELLAFLSPTLVANLKLVSTVPDQVSAGQLIKALSNVGLLAQVDAVVAQADTLTQRLWARAAIFPRNDPMVAAIATALNVSSTELDNLFRLAKNL